MAQLASLSAGDVRTVVGRFGDLLDAYREVINRLNVYPVPDGDTGTNMSLTVASVVKELDGVPESSSMAEVCRAVSHGSLMGARGNSGVILSQLLRGIAETLRDHESVLPATLADALSHADRMARQAVVRPVEGTILTISRAAADGAHDAKDLTGLVRSARASARTALEHTPEQLPVLAQAGVVDAGGAGLCLLLDALCNVVAGDALPEAPPLEHIPAHNPEAAAVHDTSHDDSLRYEVMYFLETNDGALAGFKDVWAGIGDSIVVVGGDGIGRIFRSLGVRQLVTGGQSMNPSTEELLAAVASTGSAEVVLLPNNKNIIPVANQVAAVSSIPVHVVATSSIVEGFAALLAYDPDAPGAANGLAMSSSAKHVLAAEVTQAVRDTTTDAGVVREGDWIGLTSAGVQSIAESVAVAACALLDRVVDDTHELVTVIEGDGATPANTRRITQWLAEERPGVAVEVHHGGQPLYPYLFGIE